MHRGIGRKLLGVWPRRLDESITSGVHQSLCHKEVICGLCKYGERPLRKLESWMKVTV
jgi:hypothetical protein